VIIAHTIKGRGVSFMENNPEFHGKAPTPEERKGLKGINSEATVLYQGAYGRRVVRKENPDVIVLMLTFPGQL